MIRKPGDPEFIHKLRALIRDEVRACIDEVLSGTIDEARNIVTGRLAEKIPEFISSPRTPARALGSHAPRPGRQPNLDDPRLPPPGTELVKEYKGQRIHVVVREDGFEYGGKTYPSLSSIVQAVTGQRQSGFMFFQAELAKHTGNTKR